VREVARREVIERAAREVKEALEEGVFRLLLGHGSGSFGHYPAWKYGVHRGLKKGWWGLAETGAVAARLNRLVTDIFLDTGVPVISFQPSASARCRAGELIHLEVGPIREALAHGLVPLVYGDVAFDEERGSAIISTEEIFAYLSSHLFPQRIILAGEVEGVHTGDPEVDPQAPLLKRISPADLPQLENALAGSPIVDVTGGMLAKVRIMCRIVESQPSLEVRFISGKREGFIKRALLHPRARLGTVLRAS
jgi:isopentenyl phosphate kinase